MGGVATAIWFFFLGSSTQRIGPCQFVAVQTTNGGAIAVQTEHG